METGLKFFSSLLDKLDFFRIGRTIACLKEDGTMPDCRESLIIFVIIGMRQSRWVMRSGVGIGSREHDLGDADLIIEATSSSVTGRN